MYYRRQCIALSQLTWNINWSVKLIPTALGISTCNKTVFITLLWNITVELCSLFKDQSLSLITWWSTVDSGMNTGNSQHQPARWWYIDWVEFIIPSAPSGEVVIACGFVCSVPGVYQYILIIPFWQWKYRTMSCQYEHTCFLIFFKNTHILSCI